MLAEAVEGAVDSQELIGAVDRDGGRLCCPPLMLGADGKETPVSKDLVLAPKMDGTIVVEPGVKVMRGAWVPAVDDEDNQGLAELLEDAELEAVTAELLT